MRLPRVRITIGELMAGTLVVALALWPIVLTLRSPTVELIVATAAYEIICLPAMSTLLVLAIMKPGRVRSWVILSLCTMPLLVLLAVYLVVALMAPVSFLLELRDPVRLWHEIATTPRWLWVFVLILIAKTSGAWARRRRAVPGESRDGPKEKGSSATREGRGEPAEPDGRCSAIRARKDEGESR
jgi:hypothetical protein